MLGIFLMGLSAIVIVRSLRSGKSTFGSLASLSLFSILLALKGIDLILSPAAAALVQSGQMRSELAEDARRARVNAERAAHHPWRFNDVWPIPPAPQRLVVLGDSFVFGDGLTEDARWSRQLEILLRRENLELQVLHWGRNGWNTKDQLEFLEKHRNDLPKIDLLLIGFVVNDVDSEKVHPFPRTHLVTALFSPFEDFLPSMSNFFSKRTARDEQGAYEEALYGEKGLQDYRAIVVRLREVTASLGIETRVVLTPNRCHPEIARRFDLVQTIFEAAGFRVLNLLPRVCSEEPSLPISELAASSVNDHPGPGLTRIFAREVFEVLEKEARSPVTFSKTRALMSLPVKNYSY